jgi:type IV pilus biogenesis protein CpaD/CtpE
MKKRFVRLQLDNLEYDLMLLMKKTLLAFAGASLLVLAGCASKPPAKEQAIVGQVPADPPKNPVISAETLKAESKSIAVTDIYFKKEGKNLVFIEETRNKTNNNITSTIAPRTIEVDADKANASIVPSTPSSPIKLPPPVAQATTTC